MEFRIPKAAEGPLAEFIKLSDGEVERLVEAVRRAKPSLLPAAFAQEVASTSGIAAGRVEAILSAFGGMYLARISAGSSLDAFVAALSSALQKRGDEVPQPRDWNAFQTNVKTLLACEDSLGVTAKAMDLMTDHERNFHDTRIVTDVRHIFAADPAQPPKAAVVAHVLNLVYSEIDGVKEMYLALDASDLKRLKSVIERAEAKEANLRKMIRDTGLVCLETP